MAININNADHAYSQVVFDHDRPLITNCFIPGIAEAAGLWPSPDLDMFLTNLILADQEGRPLSYSRNKDNYPYWGITWGRTDHAVNVITAAGLASEWRQKRGVRGWQSWMTATDDLMDVASKVDQQPIYTASDPIILRSRKDGSLLPLPPMRDRLRQVERINEMLSSIQLDLSMTGALRLQNGLYLFERTKVDQVGNPRKVHQKLRLDRMTGRRVFTTDLQHHGRFYCPAQDIPSDARLNLRMNGDRVVELDFRSMHVALAYHLCGAQMDGYPYDIPGYSKKQAKLGLLVSFNAKTLQAATCALTDARGGQPVFASRKEAARCLEAIKTRHAPIAKMLCSDAGMVLMNLDSRIMLAAVERLYSLGIPAVPIHDSSVVPAQFESEAHEALNFG